LLGKRREEDGGQFYERVKKKNVYAKDLNTGWINDYASKHLLGITMKPTGNGNEVNCDGYNVTYKHVD